MNDAEYSARSAIERARGELNELATDLADYCCYMLPWVESPHCMKGQRLEPKIRPEFELRVNEYRKAKAEFDAAFAHWEPIRRENYLALSATYARKSEPSEPLNEQADPDRSDENDAQSSVQ